jgi:hypothetical protein
MLVASFAACSDDDVASTPSGSYSNLVSFDYFIPSDSTMTSIQGSLWESDSSSQYLKSEKDLETDLWKTYEMKYVSANIDYPDAATPFSSVKSIRVQANFNDGTTNKFYLKNIKYGALNLVFDENSEVPGIYDARSSGCTFSIVEMDGEWCLAVTNATPVDQYESFSIELQFDLP